MTLTEFPEVPDGSSSRGCEVGGQGQEALGVENLGGEQECHFKRKPQLVPGSPVGTKTGSPCCLQDIPYTGRRRYPQAWLMGWASKPLDLGLLRAGSSRLTSTLRVSQTAALGSPPPQSQPWLQESAHRGNLQTPSLLCLSLSVCGGETRPTGLSDSAAPGRAEGGSEEASRSKLPSLQAVSLFLNRS